MHGNPELWHALCERLAQISGAFLRVQAAAGASAVQLFDSWVGALNRADYVRFVQRHSAAALAAVADLDVPKIHFGVGTGELLRDMGEAGADVVGVDYRVSLTDAVSRLGPRYAVQGNLDPALLFAPWEALERRVREIVEEGRQAPGHIFNLGHGVLPSVDPDVLTRVTALVHEVSAR
jgi:uroporphyrinogen decarboxylase